jgi:multidrug efflux system membrane fusion protein
MSSSIIREPLEDIDLERKHEPIDRPPSGRRWWRWLFLLVVLAGAGYLIQKGIAKNQAQTASANTAKSRQLSIPITAATAKKGDVKVCLNGLGSVTAFNTVTVKTRVDGQLVKLPFQEGQFVRQGDRLAEIDPRPFEVQLEQAQGQLAKDQAQLNNAKIDLQRYQLLISQDAIPQQQVATQAAAVGQLEGAIQSDNAAIDTAKLQLVYCHIAAPISGRIGLRLVDVGNMVHAADPNGIVVITQVQPIAVLFTLPEDTLRPVLEKLRTGQQLPVEAYDRSGTVKIASGSLSTVDNQIDPSTGTLRLKAVFENQDNSLFPNQFVNVKLLTDVKKNEVIIPVVAVQRGPQGSFVYVVKRDNTVAVREIITGTTSDNNISVDRGLSAGETVVVDGMDKLREGSKVRLEGNKGANGSGRRPPR